MSNLLEEENQVHSNSIDHETNENIVAHPLLTVADFNGDGSVDLTDIQGLLLRHNSLDGEDSYHPLYDLNADHKIDSDDIIIAMQTLGEDVPLLDQQIAQATQATMKYYGINGLENAIADGYIPITQELKGHGTHYGNLAIFLETKNLEQADLNRPVGLNYDAEGNLLAVFYLREPLRQEANPDNPLAELLINPEDNFPPNSFDTLSSEDWHMHRSAWIIGLGNLNAETVYFEEDVPVEMIASRLEQTQFKLFPQSDQFYSPQVWMSHGWFHSLNANGTFAITNPQIAPFAIEELGAHGGHHDSAPLIRGTDENEELLGTAETERINGFGGDDWIIGGLGDDSIWGSQGDDLVRGDLDNSLEGGDDMLYGGPGSDIIYGQVGNDRLFGGTGDDQLWGGAGDDLLRGSLGFDILTGNEGMDSFVLTPGEGRDIITDFEIEFDTLVFNGGITSEQLSLNQINTDTVIGFADETLAILSGVDASGLMTASNFV